MPREYRKHKFRLKAKTTTAEGKREYQRKLMRVRRKTPCLQRALRVEVKPYHVK